MIQEFKGGCVAGRVGGGGVGGRVGGGGDRESSVAQTTTPSTTKIFQRVDVGKVCKKVKV